MKNVLFFTHYLNSGGAEKVVRVLSKYINSHDYGYKVYICVIFDDPSYHDEVDDVIVLPHRSQKGDSKLVRGINVLRQMKDLKKVKKEYNIDICVSFLPGSDFINVFSDIGEKRVLSVRAQESRFVHGWFRKKYIQTTHKRCDRLVSVTEVVKRDCIDFFGTPEGKITTIYNPVYCSRVDETILPKVQEFIDDKRIITHVGRLSPEKGQQHILRAFSYLIDSEKYDDVRLLMIGDGQEKDSLQRLTIDLGIEKKVMFTGNVANPYAYLEKSDAFILASYFEGMPNVLLEAMQCGVPCISSDCGAREILAPDTDVNVKTESVEEGQYGLLVPVCDKPDYSRVTVYEDEKLMADAMKQLLTDEDLSARYKELYKNYVKAFEMGPIVQKWIDVLDSL
nr:glycosyltransferase [uncultured Butyrivibrio sp.]